MWRIFFTLVYVVNSHLRAYTSIKCVIARAFAYLCVQFEYAVGSRVCEGR